jgi:hypothetical protein
MVKATGIASNKKGNGMGDEKGDGNANKEGDGNQRQQHKKWLRQRGWWAFDGGNDGDGTKDTAACATTGESGGNGSKIVNVP